MSVRLLSVGEVMAEIRQDSGGAFQVGFAGDTFNTAVYCARELDEPGAVGYLSCLGEDPLSRSLMPTFEDEGIDVRAIRFDQERNIGIYSVSTDEKGERSFHYWRSQSAARSLFGTDADLEKLEQAEIVYLSGITLAILEAGARNNLFRQLSKLRDAGRIQIAFDSNYRPSLWESRKAALDAINGFWEIADIALPSIDDEMDLYGETEDEVVQRFGRRQWKACAIKRGHLGPLSPGSPASDEEFQPAERVIDTTAAGDSFNGGYLAAVLSGRSEMECLTAGHKLARKVVQVRGAITPRDK